MNVIFEIGGIGSGIYLHKHLIFGWQYGSMDGPVCGLDEYSPRQANVIIDRLPQHMHVGVRKWYADKRAARLTRCLVKRKAQLAHRAWVKADLAAVKARREITHPTNSKLYELARSWMVDANGEFKALLCNVLKSSVPRTYLEEVYASEEFPRGWIADLCPSISKW